MSKIVYQIIIVYSRGINLSKLYKIKTKLKS